VDRIELVYWVPRGWPHAVVGVTNLDVVDRVYYGLAELDHHYDMKALLRFFDRRRIPIAMLVETTKGWHIYTAYYHRSPIKVYHTMARLPLVDKGHLSLARKHRGDFKLILRVSPKYAKPDLRVVYTDENVMSEWHLQVKELIEAFWRYSK